MKEISPANIIKLGWSEERILGELAKCELVCATCYGERTYFRRHPDEVRPDPKARQRMPAA
jgi:hypothetical protein